MPRESLGAKRERGRLVLDLLRRLYPDARTELRFETPFQLLIATLLSAQATDVSVNAATPALFAAYPDASALAMATPDEVEPYNMWTPGVPVPVGADARGVYVDPIYF